MRIPIRTEKTDLLVGDKLRRIEAHVTYSYEYETDAPDFDYGDELENKREMRRFETGELLNVTLYCVVSALGEVGTDCLGQCFVKASSAETDLIQIAIEHDMRNQACLELANNILVQYRLLKRALEVGAQ